MLQRLLVVILLLLTACAPVLWTPIHTTQLSKDGELVEASVPSQSLTTIRIEFAGGEYGRIGEFTVRYAAGRTYRLSEHMFVTEGTPLIVHIPRGKVVQVTLKCDFPVSMAYNVGRIFPRLTISGAER